MYTRVPLGNIVGIQKGAYILSPLQEAGKDRSQNYGFTVSYRPLDQVMTRVTSYSMNNMPVVQEDPLSMTAAVESMTISHQSPPTSPRRAHHHRTTSATSAGSNNSKKQQQNSQRRSLSKLLSNVPSAHGDEVVFVAFKCLPMDYAKERDPTSSSAETFGRSMDGGGSTGYVGRKGMTCQDKVEEMCALLVSACVDAGGGYVEGGLKFLTEKDIVSLSEAQRSTPVFAKAEYAIKRLLWLGN